MPRQLVATRKHVIDVVGVFLERNCVGDPSLLPTRGGFEIFATPFASSSICTAPAPTASPHAATTAVPLALSRGTRSAGATPVVQ
jgi:hypothetical protein